MNRASAATNPTASASPQPPTFPAPHRPEQVPLALYLHLPWCRSKCPYCDFNSHVSAMREPEYCAALERDLASAAPRTARRRITSVYFGGGTPSLFAPTSLERILEQCAAKLRLERGSEISLEANPESATVTRLRDYRQLGINRLSLGIQSFSPIALRALGRAHDATQARRAVLAARQAGFDNLNLDLMYGLPAQTPAQSLEDLQQALAFAPEHLSWYQLTLEPGTAFARRPPSALPDSERLETMERMGYDLLETQGYKRYEISSWARPGKQCRHNLNYWRFGDYLGLGAGAHGKLSSEFSVEREYKPRSPAHYMRTAGNAAGRTTRSLHPSDLRLEFFLNALRLPAGVAPGLWQRRTGLPLAAVRGPLEQAREKGWLHWTTNRIRPTKTGLRWLNEMLQFFLPETRPTVPKD